MLWEKEEGGILDFGFTIKRQNSVRKCKIIRTKKKAA